MAPVRQIRTKEDRSTSYLYPLSTKIHEDAVSSNPTFSLRPVNWNSIENGQLNANHPESSGLTAEEKYALSTRHNTSPAASSAFTLLGARHLIPNRRTRRNKSKRGESTNKILNGTRRKCLPRHAKSVVMTYLEEPEDEASAQDVNAANDAPSGAEERHVRQKSKSPDANMPG